MRTSGIAAFLLLCGVSPCAEPPGLMQVVSDRRGISLNSAWNYLMDPHEASYVLRAFYPPLSH